jgi:hypothetical protein
MYIKFKRSDAPYQTQVKTKSTERVTDSAASAITMATGVKVNSDVFQNFYQEMEVPFSHRWNIINIYKTKKLLLSPTLRFYTLHLLHLQPIKLIEANMLTFGKTI